MKLNSLKDRPEITSHKRLNRKYIHFNQLLEALNQKELTEEVCAAINEKIEAINTMATNDNSFGKQVTKSVKGIVKLLENRLKIVVKHHYRNKWLAIGMAVFGIPIGAALGSATGNSTYLAVGIPMGMVFGIAVGVGKDNKAQKEGRQLNLELKY